VPYQPVFPTKFVKSEGNRFVFSLAHL
jgi:hypothetical protein